MSCHFILIYATLVVVFYNHDTKQLQLINLLIYSLAVYNTHLFLLNFQMNRQYYFFINKGKVTYIRYTITFTFCNI